MSNKLESIDITRQISLLRNKLEFPGEYSYHDKIYPIHTPQVLVFQNPGDLSVYAVDIIEAHLVDSPDSITFPTGNTWKPMYQDMSRRGDAISALLQKRRSACVDEYVMQRSNPNYKHISYIVYTNELIGLPHHLSPEHWIRPDGTDNDPWAAANNFERELQKQNFTVINLGIGPDAKTTKGGMLPSSITETEIDEMVKTGKAIEASKHIGFIKTGTPPDFGASVIDLDQGTIFANMKNVPVPDEFPTQAITQGPGDILRGDLRVMVATDKFKQRNVESVLFQYPEVKNPASLVTLGETIILLDVSAAQRTIDRLRSEGFMN